MAPRRNPRASIPGSRRCGAALARSSTAHGPSSVRTPARRGPGRAAAPAPRAPRTTDTGLTARREAKASSRQRDETSATRRGPIPRHPRLLPRCSCQQRSAARTRARHDAPGSAARANASPGEALCPPSAVVAPLLTSVTVRCCDDRLISPSSSGLLWWGDNYVSCPGVLKCRCRFRVRLLPTTSFSDSATMCKRAS